MDFQRGPTNLATAGTWAWNIRADRIVGDEIVADLFDVDRARLKNGVPIEVLRAAVHPDDLDALNARARQTIERDVPYSLRFRLRGRDGFERLVHSTGRCFFENGEPAQFVGTTVEVAQSSEPAPSIDLLTDQVIAACETARTLGEPFRIYLLEMLLIDIAKATNVSLEHPDGMSRAN